MNVKNVDDYEDAIDLAKSIINDLGNQDVGKEIDSWSLKRTLAKANKIAKWASRTLKERGD